MAVMPASCCHARFMPAARTSTSGQAAGSALTSRLRRPQWDSAANTSFRADLLWRYAARIGRVQEIRFLTTQVAIDGDPVGGPPCERAMKSSFSLQASLQPRRAPTAVHLPRSSRAA